MQTLNDFQGKAVKLTYYQVATDLLSKVTGGLLDGAVRFKYTHYN